MATINYEMSATARNFHGDDSFIRSVMGPFGSGKSVMGLMELLLRGLAQKPAQDGIRYSRAAVIRNTFPELKTTTLKDGFETSISL